MEAETMLDSGAAAAIPGAVDNHNETPPIIYWEDPTYTRVPTAEGREAVRQWRFGLERRFGLYNADLFHRCGEACFAPRVFTDLAKPVVSGPKRRALRDSDGGGADEDALPPPRGPLDEPALHIEIIDNRLGLFGCPRSGQVHVCAGTEEGRRAQCYAQMEDEQGNTCCRFSSWLIEGAERVFNPFTDTHISMYAGSQADGSMEREQRAVDGSGHATAAELQQRSEIDALRTRTERQELSNMAKNLENKARRRAGPAAGAAAGAPAPLSAAAEAAAAQHHRDWLDVGTVPSLEAPVATASPSRRHSFHAFPPARASVVVSGAPGRQRAPPPPKRKPNTHVALEHGLAVTRETFGKIRAVVCDLLADADANRQFNEKARALDAVADANYIDLCCRRVATVYALIKEEGDNDRLRAQAGARGLLRSRRQGACISIHVKDVTVSTLYMYARGMTIRGDFVLVARDAYLHTLLPPPKVLMWYGIDAHIRRELVSNPNARTVVKELQKYSEQSPNQAMTKIQQTFHAALEPTGRGPELLRALLGVTAVVSVRAFQDAPGASA